VLYPNVEVLRLLQAALDDLPPRNGPLRKEVFNRFRVRGPSTAPVDEQDVPVESAEVNGRLEAAGARPDDDAIVDTVGLFVVIFHKP
jgi:hypothetical protein